MNRQLSYRVLLQSLKLRGTHGIYQEEEEIGNNFEFNVEARVSSFPNEAKDELEGTLDYVELIKLIKEQNEKRSKTLEDLGRRIIKEAYDRFPNLENIKLKIEKIDPPLTDEIRSVGIELEESRRKGND